MHATDDRIRAAHNLRLGRFGERAAARYLRRLKYRILARNLELPEGEIDLVCLNPERTALVIVEVKAGGVAPGKAPGQALNQAPKQNTPPRIARPEEHVTQSKADRLRHLARRAHAEHQRRPGVERLGLRIDVIGIDAAPSTSAIARLGGGFSVVDLRHHVNAVGF